MMRILSLKQACQKLQMAGMAISPTKLGAGLQQRVFPFGNAIKLKEWVYEIYEPLLDKWIEERSN